MGALGRTWWVLLIALLLGGVIGYLIHYLILSFKSRKLIRTAKEIVEDAEARAREIVLAAKDEALKIRTENEAELNRRRRELQQFEERLQRRQEALEERQERLDKREHRLNRRQSQLDQFHNQLKEMEVQRIAELERIAQMSTEEAREELLRIAEENSRQEMAKVIREVEAKAMEEANERARKIIAQAIQRLAAEHVSETTVSTVSLPNDEMKGRIIGRRGRNIRAIEQATGVDVVVDDTPEAIIISSFDPVRREIARVALNRLILDGRIHPGRIEKQVEKAREEVEAIIREEGERAAIEVGIPGLHPELIRLLGVLHFRTSYGQNVLQHSKETAFLAGMMAAELGANIEVAKLGGLLHDIGKALDHNVEGPHATIGADVARRFGLPDTVINCIAAHHGEVEKEYLEAILVEAADAISSARPGARRESLEMYLKRIKGLEEIANAFEGVAQSYAIQAGRELRILVKPEEIDDLATIQLSRDIARRIEEHLQYPGQIKVTVIRETRAIDYAK